MNSVYKYFAAMALVIIAYFGLVWYSWPPLNQFPYWAGGDYFVAAIDTGILFWLVGICARRIRDA